MAVAVGVFVEVGEAESWTTVCVIDLLINSACTVPSTEFSNVATCSWLDIVGAQEFMKNHKPIVIKRARLLVI